LEIARQIGDRKGEGNYLGNLATIYTGQKDYIGALRLHEEALVIARRVFDRANEGNQLGNIAEVHLEMGNLAKASRAAKNALSLAKEIGSVHLEALHGVTLARVLSMQRDYASAVRYAAKSWRLLQDVLGREHEDTRAARKVVMSCWRALRRS
jgi:tetratricopeptide (TPR) repeat protein